MLGCGISGAGQKPPSGTTIFASVTGLRSSDDVLTLCCTFGRKVSQPYWTADLPATTQDRYITVPIGVRTAASCGLLEVRHAARPARRRHHLAGRLARPAARLLLDDQRAARTPGL